MTYTLENIYNQSIINNPVKYSRIINGNKWNRYVLENDITIKLSNNDIITIPKGFKYDLSSSPRFLWSILPPDGDFAIGALIHDYLYVNKLYNRKFNDLEMLKWSKVMNGTRKISLRNIDNYTRYYGVRLFGWFVWNK